MNGGGTTASAPVGTTARETPPETGRDGKIRVLLADDHGLLRAGLKALIDGEPDMRVVGEAGDGGEAVALTEQLTPDVVVMDIAMPGINGLVATRRIHALDLPSRVLILSVRSEEHYLRQAFQVGASGYVLKRAVDRELIEAIRTVHAGQIFLHPGAGAVLLQRQRRNGSDDDRRHLTEREREILVLTVSGYSDREVAERLHLSRKTVDGVRRRIMTKLQLHHRSELIRYALRERLLPADDA